MILSGDHSTMMEGWELPLGDLREQSHHPWSARPAGRCSEMAASVGFLLLEEARMFSKSGRIAIIYIESSNLGHGSEPLGVNLNAFLCVGCPILKELKVNCGMESCMDVRALMN